MNGHPPADLPPPRRPRSTTGRCRSCRAPAHLTPGVGWAHLGVTDGEECVAAHGPIAEYVADPNPRHTLYLAFAVSAPVPIACTLGWFGEMFGQSQFAATITALALYPFIAGAVLAGIAYARHR